MSTSRSKRRVTVTLPGTVVREMDRHDDNRSRFVQEAVERELERRRRKALGTSLDDPHPETEELAEAGFGEWWSSLPEEDPSDLLDLERGRPVRWVRERGWEPDPG